MKALRFACVLCASFVLAPVAYAGSVLPLPGVNGPSLGDPTTNLFSIENSLQLNTFSNFSSFTTISTVAGQATSTVMNNGFNFLTAAVAITGTITLPTAKPGANVFVSNNTGVGVAVFGSASPFTAGGQDFINGVIGNSLAAGGGPYRVGNGQTMQCVVPQGGNWWCQTGQ